MTPPLTVFLTHPFATQTFKTSSQLTLLSLSTLPPTLLPSSTSLSDQTFATHSLELASLLSLQSLGSSLDSSLDSSSFSRTVAQLLPLYTSCPLVPPSSNKPLVLGLHLLHLLVTSRLSEFHSTLSTYCSSLPPSLPSNPSPVTFAVSLERHLMVGSYDSVLSASASPPSPLFQAFTGTLETTVREKVADAVEVAYGEVGIEDAKRILMWKGEDFGEWVREVRSDQATQADFCQTGCCQTG